MLSYTQVASHVQKYFIKLAKAGLPVPGRMPNIATYASKSKKVRFIVHVQYTLCPFVKPYCLWLCSGYTLFRTCDYACVYVYKIENGSACIDRWIVLGHTHVVFLQGGRLKRLSRPSTFFSTMAPKVFMLGEGGKASSSSPTPPEEGEGEGGEGEEEESSDSVCVHK